ncbi:MAG TPA: serine--tRNA ligase [Candidatus Saccharibacteria bacterium]|nr:serine--tRNA ligase [Candidatus Saccharibacteria bacterium]
MLDIKFIRDNPDEVQKNAQNKGCDVDIKTLLEIDSKRRKLKAEIDELRAKRNENVAKMKGAKPTSEQISEGKDLREQLVEMERLLYEIDETFDNLIKKVPNMALKDVPIGSSEDENVVIKTVGEIPEFDFTPLNHADIANKRGWLDKERASKVAGSRFAYLKGDLVKLQFAIIQFVIDTLTDENKIIEIIRDANLDVSTKPFIPILPPYMIRTELYDAMDRLEPRDDRYKLDADDLWLQGSAEHVLGSMHTNEIFKETDLPCRYLGYATSFRREAGTYGKDMEGILRMHQFDKLEMESFTVGEDGLKEHLFFASIQEYLMKQFDLPYRVIKKCTFDIGKPNASGMDVEVWLPGQNKYRETHTADYMTDYQARRLNTRVRRKSGDVELIFTNDATAFALGRIMIAIIENGQTKDGKVRIPNVLKEYLKNKIYL